MTGESRWWIAALMLFLTACGPMKATHEGINQDWLKAEMASELTQAKSRWTAGRPSAGNYGFQIQTQSSNGRKLSLRVVIRNNKMVKIEARRGVRLSHEDIRRLMAADLSVDGLFNEIESELQTECAPIVSFDPERGYPQKLKPSCGTLRYDIQEWNAE